MSDRYVRERRRRRWHLIPPGQSGPPFAAFCGRSFPIFPEALQATMGDGEICPRCARVAKPAKRFTVTHH